MIRPTVPSGCTSRRVVAAAALAIAVFGLGAPAGAATFIVNDTTDAVDLTPGDGSCLTAGGQCTLRAAIQEANALAGADTIVVPAGTFVLTLAGAGEDAAATGDLDITQDVVIQGAGAGQTIVDGSSLDDRVFDILAGTVQVSGLTVRNGTTAAGEDGGGIRNLGTLTLTNVTVTGNTASGATGGGIQNLGAASLTDVTVSTNTASGAGGIGNVGGTMTLTGVTVSGNAADAGPGGGIVHNSPVGTLTVTNATISSNTAQGDGGGILQGGAGALTLTNVTVTANSATALGGGIRQGALGAVNVRNTIVAGNTAGGGPDCSGTLASLGGNLVQNTTGCTRTGAAAADLTDQDPRLGPLQSNGGPTRTHALLAGSPALDAADNTGCPATDQRGIARPADGTGDGAAVCDIGAYESALASFTLTVGKAGTGTGTVTSAPPGISCGANCSEPYFSTTMVTLTASPATGSLFAGWSGGGCSGTGGCVVTVTANTTVTARFEPIAAGDLTLTVVKTGTGGGTVTSAPDGIACGGDCANAYPSGTVVTLTAVAQAGSVFVGWNGGGCSGAGVCRLTLTAVTTVQATFSTRFQPSLTLSANQTTFGTGEQLSLTATVENPGSAGQADVFLAVLLPPSAGPAFGCAPGDAVVFFADNFTRVAVACASGPLSSFTPLFRGVTIPGNLLTTTVADFFAAQWTADLPPGTWTFALVLTGPGAFAAGIRTPLAIATVDVTFAP